MLAVPSSVASRRWVVATIGVIFAAVGAFTARSILQDTYLALYAGRLVAEHGPPHIDTLTVAGQGHPWVDQQWLAQLGFYELWRIGGYAGVACFASFAIAAGFGLLADILLSRGVSVVRTLMWVTVAFTVAVANTFIRAQDLAYPLFVAVVWLLLRDEARPRFSRSAALVLPVLAVWANVHGSVLLAVPIVSLYALWAAVGTYRAHDRRSLAGYLTLSLLAPAALLVTPYSPSELELYYRSVLTNPAIAQNVTEWAPAGFDAISMAFILLLFLVVAVVGFGFGRGYRPSLLLTGTSALLAVAGVHAVRYQVWFAFPSSVLVADTLSATTAAHESDGPPRGLGMLIGAAAALMLGASALIALAPERSIQLQIGCALGGMILAADALRSSRLPVLLRRTIPVALAAVPLCTGFALATTPDTTFESGLPMPAVNVAAGYAAAHPGVRIMADELTSAPLLWHHPGLAGRVAFDPRFEIYPRAALERWSRFLKAQGPDWAAATRGYGVIVVAALHSDLVRHLRHLPGWTVLYDHPDGIVLRRR